MKALTARQQEVFDLIRDHISQTGMLPTRAEVAQRLGFRSPNAAGEHLKALVRRGVIEIVSGASRGIRLLQEEKEGLPPVGRAAASEPLLAQQHIEGHCQVDPSLFKPNADFLLRASGMSMKDIGIMDGDLLAVHKTQDVRNGQVVVVRIDDGVTTKRLKKQGNKVELSPENSEFKPTVVDLHQQSFTIEGLAAGAIRNGDWLQHISEIVMPSGVAVCFSSLFIRFVCMTFLTSSDKALWHPALPMTFSNTTALLLGLVDTAVIGHLDSPVYLGGVVVGATATGFLSMLLLSLCMSATGLTAQAYGVKNPQTLARTLVQSLLSASGAGVLIALLRTLIIDLALHTVGGSEAVLEQMRRFLEIRWLNVPASLANLVLFGRSLGVQHVRAPVILSVADNIPNVVLDAWLVTGLHTNVQGAVLVTVIAEYTTLSIGLLMVRKILKLRGVSDEMLRTAWQGSLRRSLALDRDTMPRSLLL